MKKKMVKCTKNHKIFERNMRVNAKDVEEKERLHKQNKTSVEGERQPLAWLLLLFWSLSSIHSDMWFHGHYHPTL